DPDLAIGVVWPVYGPYSAEHTVTAAWAAAELVRYLNYATRAAAGLPYPAAVYDLLGGLGAVVGGLPQTLRQTAQRLTDLGNDPYAATDTLGQALTPPQAARLAVEDLAAAAGLLDSLAQRLAAAQGLAGRVDLDSRPGGEGRGVCTWSCRRLASLARHGRVGTWGGRWWSTRPGRRSSVAGCGGWCRGTRPRWWWVWWRCSGCSWWSVGRGRVLGGSRCRPGPRR